MMLRDKTISVIVIAAVCLLCALALIVASAPGKAPGDHSLSDREKEAAEAIALNTTSYFSWMPDIDLPYHVSAIDVGRVREVAPGIDRVRYLPRVELLYGNESQNGLNVSIYVDLDRNRIAYVGFSARSGPDDGRHWVLPRENGATASIFNGLGYRTVSMFNLTFIDSGYPDVLSEGDRSKVIAIAERNATVRDFMREASARGEKPELSTGAVQYIGSYADNPSYVGWNHIVQIYSVKSDGSRTEKYLAAVIDGRNNTVADVYEQTYYPPHPPHIHEMPPG